jgi:Cu/Ag efflux protein CusF
MSTLKFRLVATALMATGVWATSAIAQTTVDLSKPTAATTNAAIVAKDMSDGEVRKIDKDSKKVTLKHGAIKNLDMPGMTMVFQVKDASLLDKLEVGDKVKFVAENLNGAIVVTALQAAK